MRFHSHFGQLCLAFDLSPVELFGVFSPFIQSNFLCNSLYLLPLIFISGYVEENCFLYKPLSSLKSAFCLINPYKYQPVLSIELGDTGCPFPSSFLMFVESVLAFLARRKISSIIIISFCLQ